MTPLMAILVSGRIINLKRHESLSRRLKKTPSSSRCGPRLHSGKTCGGIHASMRVEPTEEDTRPRLWRKNPFFF